MITTMQRIVRALREMSLLAGSEHDRYLRQLPADIREGLARFHVTPEYLQLVRDEREALRTRAGRE